MSKPCFNVALKLYFIGDFDCTLDYSSSNAPVYS